MDERLLEHCELFRAFYESVIRPSSESFLASLDNPSQQKHHVVSQTVLLQCAVDYMLPIWKLHAPLPDGEAKWHQQLVADHLDEALGIEGSTYLNHKYHLIYAMSNAIKHARLDPSRNQQANKKFGGIGFDALKEHEGVVYFIPEKDYLFDFSRVILRPVCQAWLAPDFSEIEEIPDLFARPDLPHDFGGMFEFDDPIEAMIDYCNPLCASCELDGDDCKCSNFRFDGESGHFEPVKDPSFDFDHVMSRISGAY